MERGMLCLVSIIASHYRSRIYQLMDAELQCDFFFGIDNSTVKSMDLSLLSSATLSRNINVRGNWYYQESILRKTKDYRVIINDLGIQCISSWLLLIRAKLTGQRVFHWDHGWYGREGFLKRCIKHVYFGLAEGTLLYGQYARDLMVQHGFNADKLHVIHNSLDYDVQLLMRAQLVRSDMYVRHFNNNDPVMCFIGRLTPVKKLDLIIEALYLLASSKHEYYNLVMIGDGKMRSLLEEQVKKYGLEDRVWFYGESYNEMDNAEMIYNSDLCVAPGNIGLTAIHAMMFGCPCVSHGDFRWQMPEFESIVENKTGAFFERDDVKSLVDTISNWFASFGHDRDAVRIACFDEIDKNWNPHNQVMIIEKAIKE